jgi:hypothetical protein
MKTLTAVAGAIVAIVATVVLGDLASHAIRERLERLLHGCIRLAARRLPAEIREDLAQEWTAELHQILHDGHTRRLARLWHGTRYALGFLRAAPRISRDLRDGTVPFHTGHGPTPRQRLDRGAVLLHMTIFSSYVLIAVLLPGAYMLNLTRFISGRSGGPVFWMEVIIRVAVAVRLSSVIDRYRNKLTERMRPKPIAQARSHPGHSEPVQPSRGQVFLNAAAGAVVPSVALATVIGLFDGLISHDPSYRTSPTEKVAIGVVFVIFLVLLYAGVAVSDNTSRQRRVAAQSSTPGESSTSN